MGMFDVPNVCFITGLPTALYPHKWDDIEYTVTIGRKSFLLIFENGYCPSGKVKENKEILIDQLVKGNIPVNETLNNYFLEKIIDKTLA